MSQLIALGREYLQKWPTIAAYLEERPELSGWILVDDQQPCSLAIMAPNRIHYLYTAGDLRRCGYASELLNRLLNSDNVTYPLRVSIAKSDVATLGVFLKSDFQIVGFRVAGPIPTYVLEYAKPSLIAAHHDSLHLDKDCHELLDKLHIVEASPIYL